MKLNLNRAAYQKSMLILVAVVMASWVLSAPDLVVYKLGLIGLFVSGLAVGLYTTHKALAHLR